MNSPPEATDATQFLVTTRPRPNQEPAAQSPEHWARLGRCHESGLNPEEPEWHIENRLHHIRDVTLREDAHQARTGNGPAVFATLRNTSIGYHRTNGATNIAEATRRASHRPHDLIDAVTRSNTTTQ